MPEPKYGKQLNQGKELLKGNAIEVIPLRITIHFSANIIDIFFNLVSLKGCRINYPKYGFLFQFSSQKCVLKLHEMCI